MDLEDLFIQMPKKFIVFNLSPETTDIKYPYSSLLHPSKNKDISIPFSARARTVSLFVFPSDSNKRS